MIAKILKLPLHFICLLLIAWTSFAIYYSELAYSKTFSIILAIAFALFSFVTFWRLRGKWKKGALAVWVLIFAAFVAHWLSITPSHNRAWRADMARMPRAIIDGDNVKFINFRDFDYRSLSDFTPRYEEREVQISHLTSIDFFISYWTPGPVAHTFLSFNFDNAKPVCISIEARFEDHEGFNPLASLFRQFELIYVVGDERDIVRVRSNIRKEDVFMYPIRLSPAAARSLFMVYLERINQLADHPEFYHLLSNSCTINIVRYANLIGREGNWDIRLILNGWSDRYLYRAGLIDNNLPFKQAREQAFINPLAQAADDAPDFSRQIRKAHSQTPL